MSFNLRNNCFYFQRSVYSFLDPSLDKYAKRHFNLELPVVCHDQTKQIELSLKEQYKWVYFRYRECSKAQANLLFGLFATILVAGVFIKKSEAFPIFFRVFSLLILLSYFYDRFQNNKPDFQKIIEKQHCIYEFAQRTAEKDLSSIKDSCIDDEGNYLDAILYEKIPKDRIHEGQYMIIDGYPLHISTALNSMLTRQNCESGQIPHPIEQRALTRDEESEVLEHIAKVLLVDKAKLKMCFDENAFYHFMAGLLMEALLQELPEFGIKYPLTQLEELRNHFYSEFKQLDKSKIHLTMFKLLLDDKVIWKKLFDVKQKTFNIIPLEYDLECSEHVLKVSKEVKLKAAMEAYLQQLPSSNNL